MNSLVQGTQTRALECVAEKFVVDFARNRGVTRELWHSQQSKAYFQRLTGEFIGSSQLQKWAVDDVLLETPEFTLAMLGQLCQRVVKKHRAMTKVYDSVCSMSAASARMNNEAHETRQLFALVQQQLALRIGKLEAQLNGTDLTHQGFVHCEQVFARWQAGHYLSFSPAGRCYVALQELYWGTFGDALRFGSTLQASELIEQARALAIRQLAQDVNASARTRHYYYEWLMFPSTPSMMESKDALAWLGDDCDREYQPVSFATTQTHLGVSLGMPRICSAMRLGSAMVDEVFI
ncbi:YjcZ-like family protein [Buttiauxella sp. WJP83]|uniref:diguanylate cyclase regulator RdcB family protein n=1 Tax=Buttiauxella sp. WJP83 TaxID=2986951 RepID=UPI0022DD8A5C|nr:diguanylate cyclase regulator RdcB family protein [Buttiauxella sp. WJP83]WBM70344.1 YjcZ-like family protein [Buttiauxella sp. WJP83]